MTGAATAATSPTPPTNPVRLRAQVGVAVRGWLAAGGDRAVLSEALRREAEALRA